MFIFYYRSSFLWDVVCSERIILIAGISCSLKLYETVNSVLNILLIRVNFICIESRQKVFFLFESVKCRMSFVNVESAYLLNIYKNEISLES